MRSYRILRTALRALRRNIMRSLLTVLGIVIGIAAVIAMMEIGKGSSSAIQRTISSMGGNNLLVMPGTAASGGVSFGAGSILTLTPQDADAIKQECPAVRAAVPVVRARTQVIYGDRNWVPLYIYGTTPALLDVHDWSDLAAGQPFTDADVRNGSTVCLLGETMVRELFQGRSLIGKEVRVQSISFRVVGVLARKGANMMGVDQDDSLLAPWTAIKYRVTGSSVANVNQSSGAASQVNTLDQIYPGAQNALYPLPSDTQAADTPMTAQFTNVDQVLTAAVSSADIPIAI